MRECLVLAAWLSGAAAAALPAATRAWEADAILGEWDTREKTSKLAVVHCGERYRGDLVWLKELDYPPGSKDGTPGTTVLDHNNPDPALRRVPLLGLRIMRDFAFEGGAWSGGTVYDPKNGKTYRGKVSRPSPTRLNLRAHVGIPLFGRTSQWTRERP